MAFKTLLVHVEDTPEAEARLAAAAELAGRWSARLIGVGGCMPASVEQPFVASIDVESLLVLDDAERNDLASAEARFHRLTATLGEHASWRSGKAYPEQVALGSAAGADLIVAGCVGGPAASTLDPGALALHAGIPVLALPAVPPGLQLQHLIVAWKATREARRAVTDALPLLKGGRSVHVVEVRRDADDVDPWGGLTGAVERLAAHGIAATSERIRPEPNGAADALLACAARRGADVIVSGAYGHSRLREWSFGGMTRDLLKRSPLPVLFSH